MTGPMWHNDSQPVRQDRIPAGGPAVTFPFSGTEPITMVAVAILDDYQKVALTSADWSPVAGRADVTVFTDHIADETALIRRLAPFDVIVAMRERTAFPRRCGLLRRGRAGHRRVAGRQPGPGPGIVGPSGGGRTRG
jgi:hypothetical protein